MNYKIREKDEFTIYGYKKKILCSDTDFSKFWNELSENKKLEKIIEINGSENGLFGVSHMQNNYMDYYIGITKKNGEDSIVIPKSTWLVFEIIGSIPDALQKGFLNIMEYLKNTDYKIKKGIDIEYYYEGDTNSDNYVSEIWINVE